MGRYSRLTLLIPDKPDVERDAVAAAWSAEGGDVLRLAAFWAPPLLEQASVRVYGSETFCLVLAEKLGLTLLSPAPDLIGAVPARHLRRTVAITDLGEALAAHFPAFVKPVTPKQFASRVYASRADLERETKGLSQDAQVIRSDVVRFEAEARAFCLDGKVLTAAVYEGEAPVPRDYIQGLSNEISLPAACALDVGLVSGTGWAFLEANAAWGAGLNGCDASLTLACIERASQPAA